MVRRVIDLTGNTYGRLVVKGLDEIRSSQSEKKVKYWICQCSCGSTVTVQGNNLKSGRTTSCKCVMKEESAAGRNRQYHLYKGEQLTLREISVKTKIPFRLLQSRVSRQGKTIEQAIEEGQKPLRGEINLFTFRGQLYTVPELAMIAGISRQAMHRRLVVKKMAVADAVVPACVNKPLFK